jgi:uncharacterized membrane protein
MRTFLLVFGLLALEFLFAVMIVWLGEQRCRRRQAREEAERAAEAATVA